MQTGPEYPAPDNAAKNLPQFTSPKPGSFGGAGLGGALFARSGILTIQDLNA